MTPFDGRVPAGGDARRRAPAGDPRSRLGYGRGAAHTAARAVPAVLLACGAGADPVRKVSESSLRNATATEATGALRGLGCTVRGIRCRTPSAERIAVVRVTCTGRSSRGEPVRVDGVAYQAGSAHSRQEYVIRAAGREVARRPCLGQTCGDRS